MVSAETAKNIFNCGGIVRTSELLSSGCRDYEISALCRSGVVERVKNGYYRLSGENGTSEEILLEKLLPQGIVCVESALFYYGYSDFTPRVWSIAVPRSFSRKVKSVNELVPVKAYYVRPELYGLGKTEGDFNGTKLPVYDRERTICDCFKYRTRLDGEMFAKAVKAYAADNMKNLSALAEYAKQSGVYDNLMNIMEVVLNG